MCVCRFLVSNFLFILVCGGYVCVKKKTTRRVDGCLKEVPSVHLFIDSFYCYTEFFGCFLLALPLLPTILAVFFFLNGTISMP